MLGFGATYTRGLTVHCLVCSFSWRSTSSVSGKNWTVSGRRGIISSWSVIKWTHSGRSPSGSWRRRRQNSATKIVRWRMRRSGTRLRSRYNGRGGTAGIPLIARFMGPTGADRTQVGPMNFAIWDTPRWELSGNDIMTRSQLWFR